MSTTNPSGLVPLPAQQREVARALEVEIAAASAAAEAKAEIEARIVQAMQRPRDPDVCRNQLLEECRDPEFAEIALYHKPVGKKLNEETGKWEQQFATDFSIRFIEAALQIWGNTHVASKILADDIKGVTIRISVDDVQANLSFRTDAFIDRFVERRQLPKGRSPRGTRENSYGETVFLIEATGEEMRNKVGSERSKLIRDNGKRILRRKDLVECRRLVEQTLLDENAKAPDAARKKILDRFASIGIAPNLLKDYLERPIESLRPPDLVELQVIFNGLKDGDFTWNDVLKTKAAPAEGEENPPAESQARTKSGKLKEKIMGARETAAQQPPPAPDAKPEQ